MERRRMFFDKAEIVAFVPTKSSVETYNLLNRDFIKIQFDKCKECKFGIIPQESEKITLSLLKHPREIVYTKGKNKKYFDEYKEQLIKYAADYHITLTDNTRD